MTKDEMTERITALEAEVEGQRELAGHLKAQVSQLADFLLATYPDQITEGGAVDVAIKLLTPMEGEALAPVEALRIALADHLTACGIPDPQSETTTVLAHVADFARHSSRFGESTVQALMSLAE